MSATVWLVQWLNILDIPYMEVIDTLACLNNIYVNFHLKKCYKNWSVCSGGSRGGSGGFA